MFLQSSAGNYYEMNSVKSDNYRLLKSSKRDSNIDDLPGKLCENSSVNLSELSNELLMQSYSNGNTEAFEVLYRRHQAPLYRYCVRQFRNLSIAEECYQEIWMKIVRSRSRYQSTAKFTTYLYRIAQNHIIDTYRKEKKRSSNCEYDENLNEEESSSQMGTNSPNQFGIDSSNGKVLALRKAIGELPFDQKNTLLLKMDNGLSIDQIAEITGCKKESVKSRIRYATAKLKQLLQLNADNSSEVI